MLCPAKIGRDLRGFSIIELVMAIGIASIVMSIAMPQLRTVQAQYQFLGAVNQLALEISRARMQAVGQNSFVRFVVLSENQYARERSSDGVVFVRDATVTLPPHVTMMAPYGAPSFNRNGLAGSTTSITLRRDVGSNSFVKTVQTNILGRVSTS